MKYSEDTPGDILCFETDHKKSIWYQTHDSMWHFQDKLIWMNRHREEQDGRKKRLCGTPFCGSEWLELYGKWLCKRLFFDGVYQTGNPGGKRNNIWLDQTAFKTAGTVLSLWKWGCGVWICEPICSDHNRRRNALSSGYQWTGKRGTFKADEEEKASYAFCKERKGSFAEDRTVGWSVWSGKDNGIYSRKMSGSKGIYTERRASLEKNAWKVL